MALVTVTGKLTDAGGAPFPANLEPRLYAVPLKATAFGEALLSDDEVLATLASSGSFSVDIENPPGVRYVMFLDRLIPGQELEPPEKRARSWVQWSDPFFPGAGGDIGDLSGTEDYIGVLWIGPTPPPNGPPWPVGTRWLDSNPASDDFAWIKKWE